MPIQSISCSHRLQKAVGPPVRLCQADTEEGQGRCLQVSEHRLERRWEGTQRPRGRMPVPGERPVHEQVATDTVSNRDVMGTQVAAFCPVSQAVPKGSKYTSHTTSAVFSRRHWPMVS